MGAAAGTTGLALSHIRSSIFDVSIGVGTKVSVSGKIPVKLPDRFWGYERWPGMTEVGWIPECLLREPPVTPPAKL